MKSPLRENCTMGSVGVGAPYGTPSARQKIRKEINQAKKDVTNDIVENLEKKLGTALGGSRVKGKLTIKGSKSYYHADVGAAANHLQLGIVKIID